MVEDDPDLLEQRAGRYERIIRFVNNDQAVHVLRDMALSYRLRAKEMRKRHSASTFAGMKPWAQIPSRSC